MKTTLFAAAAVLALGIGSAFAGEANNEPFGPATNGIINAGPTFNGIALLPTNGQNGAIQTANSLPSAPEIGGNAAGQVAGLNPALHTVQEGYATAQAGRRTFVR